MLPSNPSQSSTLNQSIHSQSLSGLSLASSLLLFAKFRARLDSYEDLFVPFNISRAGILSRLDEWEDIRMTLSGNTCVLLHLYLRKNVERLFFCMEPLFDGLCKKGKIRMTARWLCKKGTILVNVLVDALAKKGNTKEVEEVIELLKEMEVGPLRPPIVIIKGFWCIGFA
ncbi:hypothetical protein RHSIM_Rhsim08G0114400 [Rhododendron simsii]|uniref:Pentatricopeptide repeat-containing protein n=1 Tax=Rhododendron simsii TaxID=118357 RepID=A0A834GM92_RHOSS|nr:hypothetical protein RHSIM_Rhsim08G0114400 [Rhododendron simsii]